MIRSTRALVLVPVAALAVLAVGCGDDSSGPSIVTDCPEAAVWMQALSDSLAAIPDNPGTDFVQNLRYDDIRDGFDAALAGNADCTIAHLGSALMDILEINYDATLWALIDSLENHFDSPGPSPPGGLHLRRGSPILHNQFALLATAPTEMMRRSALAVPSNISVAQAQLIFENTVIPALTSAIGHLQSAEAGGGPTFLITVEDETNEIDLGEVYLFHAGLHAARAAFRIATAYDYGVPGSDGTYDWIDEIDGIEDCQETGYFELTRGGPTYRAVQIYYEHSAGSASQDSIGVSVVQYNLENRAAFLTQRNGGMAAAFDDIVTARDLLELAAASIRGETDDQTNDAVRIADLVDIDNDIASPDPNRPNFAENFTTIEDVLTWVDQVLSGPYQVSEDGDVGPLQFTVDLSGFFHNAPTDWKALLPYHQFKDPATWLTDEQRSSNTFPTSYGTPVYVYDCNLGPQFRTDVVEKTEEWRTVKMDPIQFTDSGGTPIDLGVEKVPHMPDYTLGGLFPGADRAKWLEIHTNAGW
ncbi:hypothetical protein K8I85_13870 [bacterium]|nr:hypothetical protein [bacterium]